METKRKIKKVKKINNDFITKTYLEEGLEEALHNHDKEMFERYSLEYINVPVKSYYYLLIYIEMLIARNEFESASILLNEMSFKSFDKRVMYGRYMRDIIATAVGLGLYELAYEKLINNEEYINDGIFEYDAVLIYLKNKLGIEYEIEENAPYNIRQIANYDKSELLSNTTDLNNYRVNQGCRNVELRDKDTAIFNIDIVSIKSLVKKIQKCISNEEYSEYSRSLATIFDEYIFKYPQACSYLGEYCDYIKAVVIKGSNNIISIQPAIKEFDQPSIKLR